MDLTPISPFPIFTVRLPSLCILGAAAERVERVGLGEGEVTKETYPMPLSDCGLLTIDQLRQYVADGTIDTVINAICDMQGRLMGKRVTGDFFVEHCLEHGTHFCIYLLGTEMEMTTPGGYQLMNWETGYGDWQARPDWSTLRVIPWLEKTALVLADVVDEESDRAIAVAPRTILRRQVERAAALGLHPKMASELEFYLLNDTYEA